MTTLDTIIVTVIVILLSIGPVIVGHGAAHLRWKP